MHPTQMLSEKIFPVEFVAFAFDCTLWAGRTAVVCQAEMLRCDVAFPFVLGAEGASTAGEREGAGKRSGMRCSNVLAERGRVLERGVAAE